MRKIKRPKIGEYVLVSHWRDKDPNDAWYIGFIEKVTEEKRGFYYYVSGSRRGWRHVWRITPDEGREWIERYGANWNDKSH